MSHPQLSNTNSPLFDPAEMRAVGANCKSLNHLIVFFFPYLNLHLSQTQCVHHEKLHFSNITGKNPIQMGLFCLDSL